jgi:hypothetical protein
MHSGDCWHAENKRWLYSSTLEKRDDEDGALHIVSMLSPDNGTQDTKWEKMCAVRRKESVRIQKYIEKKGRKIQAKRRTENTTRYE